jgi:hypothetical protein
MYFHYLKFMNIFFSSAVTQKFGMERSDFKKLNNVEVKKHHQVKKVHICSFVKL